MIFLYRLLIFLLTPVIIGHILWLSISSKQSRYFWQRLGFKNSHLPKNSLWFHCASVGEVNTLLPLLKNLHKKNGQLKMVITSNTITGGKIVKQQNLDYLFHSYLPFDCPYAVKRFLSAIQPVSLFVMETEIWPNLFTACNNKNIDIYIINARLSKKTTSANKWVKSLLKYSLSKVTAIYTRSENNSLAYQQLGAAENIIKTIGNLKLATAMPEKQTSQKNAVSIERDYVLLASTHQNEEQQIYNIWKKLNRSELLVIAPRHPERRASIIKQLDCDNITIRSKKQLITDKTEVFLLDTVGELKSYFKNAKLVIMGGSFTPIGGHNILEPASYNTTVITGPYMENFKEELDLMLEKKAIVQVNSVDELEKQLQQLLDNKNLRENLQNNTAKLAYNAEKILEDYSKLILDEE